jgi:hypothetical protein
VGFLDGCAHSLLHQKQTPSRGFCVIMGRVLSHGGYMTLDHRLKKHDHDHAHKEAARDLKTALKRIRELEREVDAATAIQTVQTFKIRPQDPGWGKSEATAIALASDWHVGEVVQAKHVSGLNRYNPDIAKKRSEIFFRRIVRMLDKERQDVRIDTLILGLLGDFITGRIHEENLETTAMRPVDETMFAQELLASGIAFLHENTDLRLVIPCHVGNHSRITTKVHSATETGNSLEFFMYKSLARHFQSHERIAFVVGEGYHGYVDCYGKTLRFHHGHAVNYGGGVGGLTIPLIKAIHSWNLTKQAHQDFMGHFHQYTPHRRFMVNGSMIGYSAYALRVKAEYEPPQQVFCLWDRDRGKTVTMPILFD